MPRRHDNEPEPLIIDRAAAAEIPSTDAVREWAREKRAFVSSVMSELPEERKAAAAAIRAVGARPVMFEQFGGRDSDAEEAYLAEVETSEIYIGILGKRYGKPLPSRFSATHAEYLHAERRGLRIAVWTLKTESREGHEQSFLDEVRTFHVAPEFNSPEDFQVQVEDRLRAIAAEDLAPWCKLRNVVFRATEVTDRGDELSVTARVRSDEVAHALERFRGDRGNRGEDGRFTWAGRSKYVRVRSLESTTTTARSRTMRLHLEVVEAPRDNMLEVSIGNLGPDDLTEAAMRTALFGDRNPLADQHMGNFAEIPDPLGPLRAAQTSDEIVRPLAELLIVDALVGSDRAARVSAFNLGVRIRGIRQISLSWEPPRRYSNQTIQQRTITGAVSL
jgi:Domain of unknown function (DUF4062)